MNYIKYLSPRFSNVSDERIDMYIDPLLAYLRAVNVCNKSEENIRVNLRVITVEDIETSEHYIIRSRIIKPNSSENLLAEGSLYEIVQAGEKLQCYSDGYNQIFDCSFYLEEVVETAYWGNSSSTIQ